MTSPFVRVDAQTLTLDAARVIPRLFLPGEELSRSRAGDIVARVMALPEADVEIIAEGLLADFGPRHEHYADVLRAHAVVAAAHTVDLPDVSSARRAVLGASFTSEYAVEAAAVCNPSAFLHPDQSDLPAGAARVAISLRAIGEGHISSIGFGTAIVGPGRHWRFLPRTRPADVGRTTSGRWRHEHLRAVLADQGYLDEVGASVLRTLPAEFAGPDLDAAITTLPRGLRQSAGAAASVDLLRRLVSSTYDVTFPESSDLGQRVLFPAAAEESKGMEDARFTRFVDNDGTVEHRATYTAYDGARIAPRLLVSPDLVRFSSYRLVGPAARNKGMALFPRRVGGRFLAACRSDGESTGITSSADGIVWSDAVVVQRPHESWEVVQVGNCGPPLETERGWLLLTHGVGPMRSYAIGAILLDLDDPTRVIARTTRPLLEPVGGERDGYVPNVVYSCGALVHEGVLWLPFGIDDNRVAVASAPVADLLAAMS